jgi:hypothetical protein
MWKMLLWNMRSFNGNSHGEAEVVEIIHYACVSNDAYLIPANDLHSKFQDHSGWLYILAEVVTKLKKHKEAREILQICSQIFK